jgi:hypothetical protein
MLDTKDHRNKNHLLPDEYSLNMNIWVRLHNLFSITGFLGYVNHAVFQKIKRTQCFGNWISFCSQVRAR